MAREIHNWRQVIFIIQLFFGFPQSKYPVLPQSCIKGIWGVRDFCFWVVWPVLKKSWGPIMSNVWGHFFSCFRGQKIFFIFKKNYSVLTKKLHNTFFIKCCRTGDLNWGFTKICLATPCSIWLKVGELSSSFFLWVWFIPTSKSKLSARLTLIDCI